MSFGNLNVILNKTINILKSNPLIKTNLDTNKIAILKNIVYDEIKKDYTNITYYTIDELFKRLFNNSYSCNLNICFDDGQNCFREFEDSYDDVQVPEKYKKLDDHFNKLKNLPQPAQRSKEWYDYRYNRITASDTAAAIDLNPYEPVESFILKKCDPNFPFRDNAIVFHGKKYEPTATMIYEHIYNTRVFEFGALPSEKYTFLGASPDGISSKYTLDNKFSERLGTMLEIKCPVSRDIYTKGNIIGEICPFYYYCQVQQQLACCELDVCDFWQCKIVEYESREKYLSDNCSDTVNTFGNNSSPITVDNKLKKGIIIEYYPKKFTPEFEGDNIEWKSKYIIPKRLDMNESQYDEWVISVFNSPELRNQLCPDIDKDYYFNKIIYWKLVSSHNVSIKRDDKFMNSILPILQETWDKIVYYRNNQDKLGELQKIVDKRKKYIKINTNFKIHNKLIIDNKLLILDPTFDPNSLLVTKSTINKSPKTTKKYISKKVQPVTKDIESDLSDYNDVEFIDDIPEKKVPIKKGKKTKDN